MKFKKGNEVLVTSGKDRGKRGKIEKIFPKTNKVLVGGINLFKRHLKPRGEKKPGGIIDITKPISVANISLVCPKCNQQTRIGYKLSLVAGQSPASKIERSKGGKKIRICRKCDQAI